MRPALVLLAFAGCTAAPELGLDAGIADGGAAPDGGNALDGGAGPGLGFLQFRVQHDLLTDACLARGDCQLVFEEETARLDAWLAAQAAVSTQAVLHYDRAIPWDVFAVPPPPGQDLVEAYDARIDADLRDYLAAFERRFAGVEQRYLAVSLLGGTRDRLAALMRAGRRAEPSEATSAYRSSYAAMLWKLSEPAAPAEPAGVGRGSAHLTLVDLDDDEL